MWLGASLAASPNSLRDVDEFLHKYCLFPPPPLDVTREANLVQVLYLKNLALLPQ